MSISTTKNKHSRLGLFGSVNKIVLCVCELAEAIKNSFAYFLIAIRVQDVFCNVLLVIITFGL